MAVLAKSAVVPHMAHVRCFFLICVETVGAHALFFFICFICTVRRPRAGIYYSVLLTLPGARCFFLALDFFNLVLSVQQARAGSEQCSVFGKRLFVFGVLFGVRI